VTWEMMRNQSSSSDPFIQLPTGAWVSFYLLKRVAGNFASVKDYERLLLLSEQDIYYIVAEWAPHPMPKENNWL
jgi:hypothetical protein